jgi:hypothetical protein
MGSFMNHGGLLEVHGLAQIFQSMFGRGGQANG